MAGEFENLIMRDTRANQPAAGIPGRLYYVTDENVMERDNGSSWENVESAAGTGVARSGSTTDGHLAVWNGSDADSIKDGGAIGLTQTNLGKTGVGGTSDTLSASKYIAKPVTPSTTKPIRGIVLRLAGNNTNPLQPVAAIFDDNSGQPGKVLAFSGMPAIAYGIQPTSTARWVYIPIFYIPAAGTQIWIVAGLVVNNANAGILYYDTGGGDYSRASTTVLADNGFSTTSGRDYSLYAVQEG